MAPPPVPTDRLVAPVQVWPRLAADLQRHAIQLLAELACNRVAAHGEWPRKEPHHAPGVHPAVAPQPTQAAA